MNLSQARDMVARLLDEETADEFQHKLPSFYDYAQKQIATTVDYIENNIIVTPLEDVRDTDISKELMTQTGKRLYKLRRIITDGEYKHLYDNVYRLYGGTDYRMLCYVYPDTISEETDLEYEFEVSPEAQPAIVYYAAAQTVITDTDQRPYYAFMDRYNNILQNISEARRNNVTVKVVEL